MKQYKTALNHLLQIPEVKKELVSCIKTTIKHEMTNLCVNKNYVLRSANIERFNWKTAHRELVTSCPTVVDLLMTVAEKSVKNVPRIVSSLGVLLFTRNQQLNTFQAINSVLMFRGHVRTKVYSTFNRAGLCNSYKTTLSTVDKICENFDVPVKKWAADVATRHELTHTCITAKDSSLFDHNYAVSSDIDNTCCSTESIMEEDQTAIYTAEPLVDPSHPDLHEPEVDDTLPLCTPVKPSTSNSNIQFTPENKSDLSPNTCMDSPFTTSIQATQEVGPFQIVMDNLNLQQKTRHKTLDTANKVHNLVHSIAIQHRVTADLDSVHPQADILSIPNDAFIPDQKDHDDLNADFKVLIKT